MAELGQRTRRGLIQAWVVWQSPAIAERPQMENVVLLMIAAVTLWCGVGTVGMLKGYAKYPEDNL